MAKHESFFHKLWQAGKKYTPIMVIARKAYQGLIRFNYRGHASRINRAKPEVKDEFKKKWEELGGNPTAMMKIIALGAKKKPFFCGKECKAHIKKVSADGGNDLSNVPDEDAIEYDGETFYNGNGQAAGDVIAGTGSLAGSAVGAGLLGGGAAAGATAAGTAGTVAAGSAVAASAPVSLPTLGVLISSAAGVIGHMVSILSKAPANDSEKDPSKSPSDPAATSAAGDDLTPKQLADAKAKLDDSLSDADKKGKNVTIGIVVIGIAIAGAAGYYYYKSKHK